MTIESQKKDSIERTVVHITEQGSSQNLSPIVTDTSRQVKDRFNAQIVVIKVNNFMNKIYDLENKVDRLKLKIKDQDNDISDKTKLSLLEYKKLSLKVKLRNKQLTVEKLLDLNSDKTNVHKPNEQSTIRKVNLTHGTNEINGKKFDTYHKKEPKAPIRENTNKHSNVNKKRVNVIGDSMVKFVKSGNFAYVNYVTNIRTNPDCTA